MPKHYTPARLPAHAWNVGDFLLVGGKVRRIKSLQIIGDKVHVKVAWMPKYTGIFPAYQEQTIGKAVKHG